MKHEALEVPAHPDLKAMLELYRATLARTPYIPPKDRATSWWLWTVRMETYLTPVGCNPTGYLRDPYSWSIQSRRRYVPGVLRARSDHLCAQTDYPVKKIDSVIARATTAVKS